MHLNFAEMMHLMRVHAEQVTLCLGDCIYECPTYLIVPTGPLAAAGCCAVNSVFQDAAHTGIRSAFEGEFKPMGLVDSCYKVHLDPSSANIGNLCAGRPLDFLLKFLSMCRIRRQFRNVLVQAGTGLCRTPHICYLQHCLCANLIES